MGALIVSCGSGFAKDQVTSLPFPQSSTRLPANPWAACSSSRALSKGRLSELKELFGSDQEQFER